MFGRIIRALIYIGFLAMAFYLVVWFLAGIGLSFPPMVVHIFSMILVLIAILVLYNLFWGDISGYNWWGRRPGP